MNKLKMQELEKFLEEELSKTTDKERAEYLNELIKIVRFSSASKYYHHV